MPAFFVATVTIKNFDKFKEYTQKTCVTYSAFEGKTLLRGRHQEVLTPASNDPHQTVAVVSFPSIEALNNWYQSDAYQALIPLRDEATDMTMTSYAVPA